MKVSFNTLRLFSSAISSPNETFVTCTTEGVRKMVSWPPLRIRCLTIPSVKFPGRLHVGTHQRPKTFDILDENASGQTGRCTTASKKVSTLQTPLMMLSLFARLHVRLERRSAIYTTRILKIRFQWYANRFIYSENIILIEIQSNVLRPYLAAVRATLTAALTLENFASQVPCSLIRFGTDHRRVTRLLNGTINQRWNAREF